MAGDVLAAGAGQHDLAAAQGEGRGRAQAGLQGLRARRPSGDAPREELACTYGNPMPDDLVCDRTSEPAEREPGTSAILG